MAFKQASKASEGYAQSVDESRKLAVGRAMGDLNANARGDTRALSAVTAVTEDANVTLLRVQ